MTAVSKFVLPMSDSDSGWSDYSDEEDNKATDAVIPDAPPLRQWRGQAYLYNAGNYEPHGPCAMWVRGGIIFAYSPTQQELMRCDLASGR